MTPMMYYDAICAILGEVVHLTHQFQISDIQGMIFSMVYTRSTVVRVPELTNAVIAGLVASCAPAAVMPLSVSPLVGPGTEAVRIMKVMKDHERS